MEEITLPYSSGNATDKQHVATGNARKVLILSEEQMIAQLLVDIVSSVLSSDVEVISCSSTASAENRLQESSHVILDIDSIPEICTSRLLSKIYSDSRSIKTAVVTTTFHKYLKEYKDRIFFIPKPAVYIPLREFLLS